MCPILRCNLHKAKSTTEQKASISPNSKEHSWGNAELNKPAHSLTEVMNPKQQQQQRCKRTRDFNPQCQLQSCTGVAGVQL